MIAAVIFGSVMIAFDNGLFESFQYLFLIPWIFALLTLLLIPLSIFAYRGWKGIENPLVLATASYFIPAFVVGGISLSVGWSNPYFLSFIQDAETNLPFTIVLIMLGYSGLAIGYFFPVGRKLAAAINTRLPDQSTETNSHYLPGFILLSVGLLSSFYAVFAGIIGFQRLDESGIFDGLIFLATLFSIQGSFILWLAVFRQSKMNFRSWSVVAFLVLTIIANALLAGNRGSLLSACILIGLAYLLSGRTLSLRKTAIGSVVIMAAILAGMIYGSAFRLTKGSEARVGMDQYVGYIGETFGQILNSNNLDTLGSGFTSLAERLDTVSSLAVVVSNYEQLAPYEESYGLDNNIWKDTTSFIVPRVLWPEKPVASDARAYSDLYFNFAENSFAITPIGDLLRNYGVAGVFIGMLVLGLLLRFIYRLLIENQPRNFWRATMYFMLMSAVSYETFYGSILPMVVKVGLTATVGCIFTEFVANRLSNARARSIQA